MGAQHLHSDNNSVSKVDEEGEPPSSPNIDNSRPNKGDGQPCSFRALCLVREEHLQGLRQNYKHVSSIHVYSLEPGPIKDLQVLSKTSKKLFFDFANEDSLEQGRTYGALQNQYVKRRAGVPTPSAIVESEVPSKSLIDRAAAEPQHLESPDKEILARPFEPSHVRQATKSEARTSLVQRGSGLPKVRSTAQGGDRSGIFKAFAKSTPKVVDQESDGAIDLSESRPSIGTESSIDSHMNEPSDDEKDQSQKQSTVVNNTEAGDESAEFQSDSNDASSQRLRKERLLKLMNDHDEPMADAGSDASESLKAPELLSQRTGEEALAEEASRISRRGKRQVVIKKTMEDEEGYLITKEETVWESFSEDESTASKTRPSTSGSKGNKTGAKGQGTIISFFGKK